VVYPKQVLNELKWKPGLRLAEAEITYVHRGAPHDEMTIGGSAIIALEHSFFVTAESKIPYHRIKRIVLGDRVLYDSRTNTPSIEETASDFVRTRE
jgi:uncharacterized protein (UPF0248 family)